MTTIKIYIKKYIRKTLQRTHYIILAALVIAFTAVGVMSTAQIISETYYSHAIAPLVSSVNLNK